MKYFRIALLLSSLAGINPCLAEPAQNFYFSNGKSTSSDGGDVLGNDTQGNIFDWASLYSEIHGTRTEELDHLRFYQKENANWTFLWSRAEDDKSAYKMVIQFVVRKEEAGSVILEVGFDDVFLKEQGTWPEGFWVSNDEAWRAPFSKTSEEAGVCDLNEDLQPITIPANAKKIHVRVRSLSGPGGLVRETDGFIWFESGTVTFEKVSDKDSGPKAGQK